MTLTMDSGPANQRAATPERPSRVWPRRALTAGVLALFTVELALGWPALSSALAQLHTPHLGWLAAAVAAELAAMRAYARMQRRLLHSAGVRVPLRRQLALTYAAHSLSVTLPGGPVFSTQFNFQQMRRFGATAAVASWCIALSGILSAAALAVVTAAGALTAHGTAPWQSLAAFTIAALLITAGLQQITRHPGTLERVTRTVLGGLNRLRRRGQADGLEQARRFLSQLRAARLTPGHAVAAAAYALLNWLLDAVCLWLCLYAVSGRPVSAAQLLLVYCAGMAAGTLTIIPGGLGIIDSALILGLITAGIAAPTAIAGVVLYRLVSLGFIAGTGWITWLIIRNRQPEPPTPAESSPHH